jgi:hypothetical protein
MTKQTKRRTKNGAVPVTKSTPDSSSRKAEETQAKSRTRAGPDGPDATEVGNTFKK